MHRVHFPGRCRFFCSGPVRRSVRLGLVSRLLGRSRPQRLRPQEARGEARRAAAPAPPAAGSHGTRGDDPVSVKRKETTSPVGTIYSAGCFGPDPTLLVFEKKKQQRKSCEQNQYPFLRENGSVTVNSQIFMSGATLIWQNTDNVNLPHCGLRTQRELRCQFMPFLRDFTQ